MNLLTEQLWFCVDGNKTFYFYFISLWTNRIRYEWINYIVFIKFVVLCCAGRAHTLKWHQHVRLERVITWKRSKVSFVVFCKTLCFLDANEHLPSRLALRGPFVRWISMNKTRVFVENVIPAKHIQYVYIHTLLATPTSWVRSLEFKQRGDAFSD